MLEKALFVTKLFLDGWEKLLSEDVLVPFFIHGCVLVQNCVSPLPWLRSNPTHEWSQDALMLALSVLRANIVSYILTTPLKRMLILSTHTRRNQSTQNEISTQLVEKH